MNVLLQLFQDAPLGGDSMFLTHAELLLRLTVSLVLGGLIGFERELRNKPAGLRTIVLISAGSCLFAIISSLAAGSDDDRTRIAAQIVTGVGFLGAGSILRGDGGIFGLTTAATIWAVTAVGMAAGFGAYILAAAGTGTILTTLLLLQIIERKVSPGHELQGYRFCTPRSEGMITEVVGMFTAARLKLLSNVWYEEGPDVVFEAVALGARGAHAALREQLLLSPRYHLRRPGAP